MARQGSTPARTLSPLSRRRARGWQPVNRPLIDLDQQNCSNRRIGRWVVAGMSTQPTDPGTRIQPEVSCKDCLLNELCLPSGLSTPDLQRLTGILMRGPTIARGEHLFSVGDPMVSLYAIRSGSAKIYQPTATGDDQVLGFCLPGELIGFDAVEAGWHSCAAVTLESTSVCEVPYGGLEQLCHECPGLDHAIHRLFAREITSDHALLQVLGKKSAEERLGCFLLNLSQRFRRRGFSEHEFNLTMSRNDIANHLGLAVETVSRLFARFQENGLLTVKRRHIEIQDLDRMREALGECPLDQICSRLSGEENHVHDG